MHQKTLVGAALALTLALLTAACQGGVTLRATPPPTLTVSAAAVLVYAFTESSTLIAR